MPVWVEYALWGLFGGFAVEGLEVYTAVRNTGKWPWRVKGEPSFLMLLSTALLIRLPVGAGLAAAAGHGGEVSGPFGALAVGVAAPLVIEQLAKQPLVGPGAEVGADSTSSGVQGTVAEGIDTRSQDAI